MSDFLKQKYIHRSLHSLRHYIEAEKFKGYDPYDTLTSPFPFRSFGKWIPMIATQIQKRNPVNIRPLLGIKKDYNPKALGLLLHAYSILQKKFPEKNYSAQLNEIYQLLLEKKSVGFSGTCWGYNFGWASSAKYLKPFIPTVVATGFIAKGLYEYYLLTKKEEVKELLLSIAPFILKDVAHTTTSEGVCISYSPVSPDCCYNASLLGAEVLAILYTLDPKEIYKTKALKAVDFVVKHQHSNGRWGYSLNLKTGKERNQTDFHQGYILESIWNITSLLKVQDEETRVAIQMGIDHYIHMQFTKNGRSYFRLPKKYPVDIHYQSQGIITFMRMKKLGPAYTLAANKIATWTIENMQDGHTGSFYYRKGRFFTNRISFMRWGQAWMFLALAEMIQPEKPENL